MIEHTVATSIHGSDSDPVSRACLAVGVPLRMWGEDTILDPWRGLPERGGCFLGEIGAARQHDL